MNWIRGFKRVKNARTNRDIRMCIIWDLNWGDTEWEMDKHKGPFRSPLKLRSYKTWKHTRKKQWKPCPLITTT